jgi:hypothetical protein
MVLRCENETNRETTMSDPFLGIFLMLLPGLFILAVLGMIVRVLIVLIALGAVVRQFNRNAEDLKLRAPAPGQMPNREWLADFSRLQQTWTHMSSLQRARSELKKAEMMGLAARAGITWSP